MRYYNFTEDFYKLGFYNLAVLMGICVFIVIALLAIVCIIFVLNVLFECILMIYTKVKDNDKTGGNQKVKKEHTVVKTYYKPKNDYKAVPEKIVYHRK